MKPLSLIFYFISRMKVLHNLKLQLLYNYLIQSFWLIPLPQLSIERGISSLRLRLAYLTHIISVLPLISYGKRKSKIGKCPLNRWKLFFFNQVPPYLHIYINMLIYSNGPHFSIFFGIWFFFYSIITNYF